MSNKEKFVSWAEEFVKGKETHPGDSLPSHVIQGMIIADRKNVSDAETKGNVMYQIVSKRSKALGLGLTSHADLMISFMSNSPGEAVMYMYAIAYHYNKDYKPGDIIGVKQVTDIFGTMPTQEFLSEMWDKQKTSGSPDNLLDLPEIGDFLHNLRTIAKTEATA